jgi:hypothetical protein
MVVGSFLRRRRGDLHSAAKVTFASETKAEWIVDPGAYSVSSASSNTTVQPFALGKSD